MTKLTGSLEVRNEINVDIIGTGARGKSAYESWLDLGNEGTEQEYLASLKGQDGYTPVKGVDYFDGKKGDPFVYDDFTPTQLEGLKGPQGEAGTDGVDGSDANVTKTNVEAALGYKIVFYTEGQTIPSLPTDTIAFIREA